MMVSLLTVGQAANWSNFASANTGGTGPGPVAHSFSFVPGEITLDAVNDSLPVVVELDGLDAGIVANTAQVTVVHDDSVLAISGATCTGLYDGASAGTTRITSEGATVIICTATTAPTDDDSDGFIAGPVVQFTVTRLVDNGDAVFSFVNNGPWQTDVVANGAFVGSPTLGTLNVLNNHAPTANSQVLSLLEDGSLPILLTGSDDNGDALTFQIETGPTNGSLSGTEPNFTYDPDPDFNGSDSFTFTATDGALVSLEATVSLTIDPVNDQPSFTPGGDQQALQDDGPQSIANWATAISAGPANEAVQNLTFSIDANTAPALFVSGPTVDGAGTLTFEPDVSQHGTATITLRLSDDGGTDDGGVDFVTTQFDITIIETRQISGPAGTVTVDGLDAGSTLSASVVLLAPGDVEIKQMTVLADGSFLLTSVPAGTYTLRTELLGFQTGELTGLVVNGGDVVMEPIVLLSGFVDADDVVAGADLSILLGAFEAGNGDPIPRQDLSDNVLDLNDDGFLTALDIDLVTVNFGSDRLVPWTVAP